MVFGFVTGIGLSLTVLSVMFFHGAAKLNKAVDLESALVWQEAESKTLARRIDAPQNETEAIGSTRPPRRRHLTDEARSIYSLLGNLKRSDDRRSRTPSACLARASSAD